MSRIAALPRRDWKERATELVQTMTSALRQCGGSRAFHPEQAIGLFEIWERRGGFMAIPVGGGKTAVAGCAFTVLDARSPLLVLPGKILEDTRQRMRGEAEHWKIPHFIRYESYETIAHPNNETLLWDMKPDVVVCDEAHKLARVKESAVARRFGRFAHDRQAETAWVFLSGTPWTRSVLDCLHLLVWSLREKAPCPLPRDEQEQWACVLDSDPRTPPTSEALKKFSFDMQVQCREPAEARQAFRERLLATPGVIVSDRSYNDHPVTFAPIDLPLAPELVPHLDRLREYAETPSGWTTADAFETYRIACDLALGFFQEFDPRPPKAWLEARKAYAKWVRVAIEAGVADSPGAIKRRFLSGELEATEWDDWQEIEKTFFPQTRIEWLSAHAIEACKTWGNTRLAEGIGGLIWIDSVEFGDQLERETDWPYFRNYGVSKQGNHVTAAPGNSIALVASKACDEGLNLQYQWHRNLVTEPWSIASFWEQRIGRTARHGQTKPVHTDYFQVIPEHATAVRKALWRAQLAQECTNLKQKAISL